MDGAVLDHGTSLNLGK